jgi:hypothetical protein
VKYFAQALAESQMEDDGCPNFPTEERATDDPLTTAAYATVRSTPWQRVDLRDAAELAARQVHALEVLGDHGRARVFLAIVDGYRVRDQRQ